MPVYLIAQLSIRDRQAYGKYEAGFMEIFQKYEGRLLAVSESVETLEGENPFTRHVLVSFPSREAARAWWDSEEYQALARHRRGASEANIVLLEGLPT